MPGASSSAVERDLAITRDLDVITAQIRSRRFAGEVGFSKQEQWQVAIAVSELATNILKFGIRGRIRLTFYIDNPPYLEVVAEDEGDGIESPAWAMRDQVSEGVDLRVEGPRPGRRGLGLGLGAVRRMMDEVEITRGDVRGTLVRARKRLRR